MRTQLWKPVLFIMLIMGVFLQAESVKIIELSWDEVARLTRIDNLSLQMEALDYQTQNAEVKKAWGGFLPTLYYQWVWSDDELSQVTMPVDNVFIHSLNLTYPIFTGGARYANLRMQQHIRKSLGAELRGAEESVVLQGLQSFYGVILAGSLVEVYEEALVLTERNLRQVESFYGVGTATDLAVMQARTRYFETIPQLESARNQRKLALNQLKMILNISGEDSLLITDKLEERKFLGVYQELQVEECKNLARDNRPEVRQVQSQGKAVDQQKLLAVSQFLPSVVLTAGKSYYGYSDDWWISRDEFEGYNSLGLVVQLPIFSGGSRYFDVKEAGYAQRKMGLLEEMTIDQVELDAEQSYYNYLESRDNLKSQQEALTMAEESLRLANLYYEEGMVTQTEVLNAQLTYTQNKAALKSGIFKYNTSQLALLKAIGDLQSIWQK